MSNPQFEHFIGKTGRECRKCQAPELSGTLMKQCSRCKAVLYCSRACQQADWKSHKKICLRTVQIQAFANASMEGKSAPPINMPPEAKTKVTGMPSSSTQETSYPVSKPVKALGLDGSLTTPFTRLYVKRWLHGRSDKDCYKLLFDALRVRLWDDKGLAAQSLVEYNKGKGTMLQASYLMVTRFLRYAVREHCLPAWWDSEKERECLDFGHSEENWKDEERPPKVHQLIARYGTATIILQMQMFAEHVYGPIAGKESYVPMLRMHMDGERSQLVGNLLKAIKDEAVVEEAAKKEAAKQEKDATKKEARKEDTAKEDTAKENASEEDSEEEL